MVRDGFSFIILVLLFVVSCAGTHERVNSSKMTENKEENKEIPAASSSPQGSLPALEKKLPSVQAQSPEKPNQATPSALPSEPASVPSSHDFLKGLQFYYGADATEWMLDGRSLSLYQETPVQLHFPTTAYWNIFRREGELVTPLNEYQLAPHDPMRKIAVNLQDFPRDLEWYLVASERELTLAEKGKIEETLARPSARTAMEERGLVKTKTQPAQENVGWHLYLMDAQVSQRKALAKIQIFHLPVVIEVMVKKQGEREFRLLSSDESVREKDEIRMKVASYKDVYCTIFLLNADKQVEQLLADADANAVRIKSHSQQLTPSFTLDNKAGKEYLCWFYDAQPLICRDLSRWLQTADLSTILAQQNVLFTNRGIDFEAWRKMQQEESTEDESEKWVEEETPQEVVPPPIPPYIILLDHK